MKKSTRIALALAVQTVAVLFGLMSWTDPLEGGVAMTLSIGLTAVAFFVGRVPVPKLTWISALAGIAIMVVFWTLYIAEAPTDPSQVDSFQPSQTIFTLLWVYRVASIAYISGVVFYAVVQFTAMRASKVTGDN